MRNGKIILAHGIKVDRDYVNVLDYTETQMVELCTTNQVAMASDYSFLDMTKGSIYTSFSYDTCLGADYIAFQNPNYSQKWFFGFIDDIVYKGDKNTEIRFTVDAWSTWFDKWTAKPCFVAREHVNDDTIGLHTVQEDLDVGQMINDNVQQVSMDYTIAIGVLTNYCPVRNGGYNTFSGTMYYGRIFFGSVLALFQTNDISAIRAFLKRADVDAKTEDIKDIFLLPGKIFDNITLTQQVFDLDGSQYTYYLVPSQNEPFSEEITYNKITTFTDYTPKNNKVKVYPYNYLYVTNNVGENNIYKFEDFSDSTCKFYNFFGISVGGSGRLVPRNYKGLAENNDESVTLAKFPTCQWSSDSYTNWLTQNAVNNRNGMLSMFGNVAGSLLEGNTGGAIATVANTYLDYQNRFYEAHLLPNKIAGTNSGDINFSTANNKYKMMRMRPKKEYLEMIDDYFTRFRLQNKQNKDSKYYR